MRQLTNMELVQVSGGAEHIVVLGGNYWSQWAIDDYMQQLINNSGGGAVISSPEYVEQEVVYYDEPEPEPVVDQAQKDANQAVATAAVHKDGVVANGQVQITTTQPINIVAFMGVPKILDIPVTNLGGAANSWITMQIPAGYIMTGVDTNGNGYPDMFDYALENSKLSLAH